MQNNQIKCQQHCKPIIKIQQFSKRLLCQNCLKESNQDRVHRIERARVKVTKQYEIELQELNQLKIKVEKIMKVFITPNMFEAKRQIKISLPEVQKLVNDLMQQQVVIANKNLSEYIEKQLQIWKSIDGKQLNYQYLEFEKQFPLLWEKIRERKKKTKVEIAEKLKLEVRMFYQQQFNF